MYQQVGSHLHSGLLPNNLCMILSIARLHHGERPAMLAFCPKQNLANTSPPNMPNNVCLHRTCSSPHTHTHTHTHTCARAKKTTAHALPRLPASLQPPRPPPPPPPPGALICSSSGVSSWSRSSASDRQAQRRAMRHFHLRLRPRERKNK